MNFADMNWMQVEDYLQNDDRVILVLGACEQHGYLSLLTDVKIPVALAKAASESTNVIIAPPLNFGCSPYFLDYPGTISLRLHTYLDLVEDILRSLYGSGFRKCLILNGHGGNIPVRTHLAELVNELPDLQIRFYSWWTTKTVEKITEKHKLDPQHANWLEAFEFTKVAELPEKDKPAAERTEDILSHHTTRAIHRDGSFGGSYQVDQRIMKEMFDACMDDVLELLRFKPNQHEEKSTSK